MSKAQSETTKDLASSFSPSEHDVICGWARQNYNHPGNKRLRNLISMNVPRYLEASTKSEKGMIISDIVEQIRSESPTGTGMVKLNKATGRWAALENDKAKDKVGHALRKATQELAKKSSSGIAMKKGSAKRAPQEQEPSSVTHSPSLQPVEPGRPPLNHSHATTHHHPHHQHHHPNAPPQSAHYGPPPPPPPQYRGHNPVYYVSPCSSAENMTPPAPDQAPMNVWGWHAHGQSQYPSLPPPSSPRWGMRWHPQWYSPNGQEHPQGSEQPNAPHSWRR